MEDYIFQVDVVDDGSCTWTKMFGSALEAVNSYNSYIDHGFADNEREVTLVEPNGVVHQKRFTRPWVKLAR